MKKSRKMRPLLAGATALLFSAGLLAGGVANAAQPGYDTYIEMDNQLTQAMNGVNGSVQAKSAADAQAAQDAANAAAQQAANAQASQSQSTQSLSASTYGGGGGYGMPSYGRGNGYSAPSYTSAPSHQAPAYTPPSNNFHATELPPPPGYTPLPSCSNIPADGKMHDCM